MTNVKKKKLNNPGYAKGSTLVELLISMALVAYVMVSILTAFSQHQISSRTTNAQNAAVYLAEQRLEEYMKFPAGQLTDTAGAPIRDYIVQKGNEFEYFDDPPQAPGEMRFIRSLTIQQDLLQQLAYLTVVVEYGDQRPDGTFARVALTTRRGE